MNSRLEATISKTGFRRFNDEILKPGKEHWILQIGRFFTIAFIMTLCFSAISYQGYAIEPAKQDKNKIVTPAATSPVTGSGTTGHLPKWTGVDGSNSFSLSNSNIFEEKFGRIGIGTTTPTSLLTVQGLIETTLGGVKFPDGTVQTTSAAGALLTVQYDSTLTGNCTSASPLGVASPLEVRDRDNPARQPVAFQFLGPYTVWAGKRLVIEYVSGFFNLATIAALEPVNSLNITTTINSESQSHYVWGHRVNNTDGQTPYIVAQNIRIYADPGAQVKLFGNSPNHVTVTRVSGYFVDVPKL